MMSEYYDRYHRWEPLAEFHFMINSDDESEEEFDDEKYFYCLCSRTFIRDAVKTYYVEKEERSESDVEVLRESQSQEWEDQSHVHFSLDTSYKVKCEKDEGASCYCSASHTDNYCSTDEHDPAQMHVTASHALQPSDSGADLTYQDCHSDYTTNDKLEKMDQDFPTQTLSDFDENYLSEDTWEKFWAINGERLIWASWIKKYSDYINPAYLGENNDLILDDNNLPKQRSADHIYENLDAGQTEDNDDSMRERKFSYDSKVNPYKKNQKSQNSTNKSGPQNKDDTWLPLARKRSCSEHDRILSPRTVAGTDSMTNVTKITLSSYDVTSSHVTSESTPTDDYSMSSSTSDDQSNDQTRIANINENVDQAPSEEMDTEQYWQLLWKKHFGEQYALHYANYIERHIEKENEIKEDLPSLNTITLQEVIEKVEEKAFEIECENSEGNSQEMPTVIEVQTKVDNIKLDDKPVKTKKRNKKNSNRILGSVGVLLQNLLKEEQKKNEMYESAEVVDAGDATTEKTESEPVMAETANTNTMTSQQPVSNTNLTSSYDYDDGDDEPPEHRTVSLKRSHEIDDEEVSAEKVRATFDMMGFCLDPALMPRGQLIYSKHPTKLRPPRHKKSGLNKKKNKKIYFDDDGNPYPAPDSQDEREMPTDYDYNEVISESEKFEHPIVKTTKESLCLEASEPDLTDIILEKPKKVKTSKKALLESTVLDIDKTELSKYEMSAEVIGPINKASEDSDKDELAPEEVALPDSTDVDTEESDETRNDVIADTVQPAITEINIKETQQIRDPAKLFYPNFKTVEVSDEIVAEKVTRPKLTVTRKKNQKKKEAVPELHSKVSVVHLQNPKHVKGEVETDSLEVDASTDLQETLETEQRVSDSPIEANMIEACRPKPKVYNRWGEVIGEEDMPPELLNDRRMVKYWKKRHSLFHRFDEGIKLDRESWFSVTPESVAWHIANKFAYDVVLDAFCGAGGNTIQFARTCGKVIAVDIDPVKIEMARHNARVYGVEDRIEFIVGDFFELAPQLQADMVFLSPPWGGPKYSEVCEYDLESMLEPRPASELMAAARQISPYIAIYVPRNTKTHQLLNLGKQKGGSVEIEQSYLGKRFVAITAYYY
ncbi:hypothetical protein ABMA28_004777 [Loxostege sticticalis]|uniref:Trimethylguanosine synthase n=1 Tax=Loxostege sticticalis TaxID=481309 RepID=A0ABD0SSK0_LOXSC